MDQKFGPPADEDQRRIMEQIEGMQQQAALDPELAAVRQRIGDLQINAEPPKTLTEPAAAPKRRRRARIRT